MYQNYYKINKCPKIHAQWLQNIPNGQNVHITTFSIPRPSNINPNWDFWSEKKTSGANPMIASYNASVVNFYNATDNLAHFENKNIFF
jgi:hypothetical protein